MFGQGVKFISHEFKNSLVETKYGIKSKSYSSDNPQENVIIEIIHQVISNLLQMYNIQETYADDADPWMGILAKTAFSV